MSRKSRYRFSEQDMRKNKNLELAPFQLKRGVLWKLQSRGQTMPLMSERPLFTIRAELASILKLGHTPYGERRIINMLGGTVDGERLKAKILPGGADWQIVRTDGVVHLHAVYTIETPAGGQILVNSEGLRHGPPEVMERLARDETVDPSLYYFRAFMRFETADPASSWLNKILAVGYGARENRAVKIDVHQVL